MKPLTRGQRWWRDQIEGYAYRRLRQLRQRRTSDGTPLWDGRPPVPLDHIIEHLLGFDISYEEIEEPNGRLVLGAIRPETREIVLNERHAELFREVPGLARSTKGHETGHADVYGLGCNGEDGGGLFGSMARYTPQRTMAARGAVLAFPEAGLALLKQCSAEVRSEVLRRLLDEQRSRFERGEDTPLVRRAVNHYAAALLMPEDLVRLAAREVTVTSWEGIGTLAGRFLVSKTAMRIRLEELGLIHGVEAWSGRILREDPAEEQIRML